MEKINRCYRPSLRILSLACLVLPGCASPKAKVEQIGTRSDRLMATYPELRASGRFAILADFEDETHMDIVHLIAVSDEARCVLDRKGGRSETGGGCVKWRAGSPDDVVVLRNVSEAAWYMKRDWRDFDLLLISVKSPEEGLLLDVMIGAGSPESPSAIQSQEKLQKGWNLLRFDLAEIAERLPLDDIRELRFSLARVDKPVELRIDDVLLTGYRRDLLGDARNQEGQLYVQEVGRRLKVGAGASFELAFSHGQIVEWYNLATDPYRLRNLVEGTVLGPTPVVLPPEEAGAGVDAGNFSHWGPVVVARQWVEEMSSVRAVVCCEWWFTEDGEAAPAMLETRPSLSWRYAIYPTGSVFSQVQASPAGAEWTPPRMGIAASIASSDQYALYAHEAAQLDVPESLRHVVYATAQPRRPDGMGLLFAIRDSRWVPNMLELRDPETGRVSFIATGPQPEGRDSTWFAEVQLLGQEDFTEDGIASRVLSYADPVAPDVAVGQLVTEAPQGADFRGGMDAATGCYTLKPSEGLVRLELEPQRYPLPAPAFRVLAEADDQVWVYVNSRLLENVARDPTGAVIFQLSGPVRDRTTVEVLLKSAAEEAEPGD